MTENLPGCKRSQMVMTLGGGEKLGQWERRVCSEAAGGAGFGKCVRADASRSAPAAACTDCLHLPTAPRRVCHPLGPGSGSRASEPQERSLIQGLQQSPDRPVEMVLPAPAPQQICQHLLTFFAPLCHTEQDQLCFWALRGPSVLLQVLLAMPVIICLLDKVINPTVFFLI